MLRCFTSSCTSSHTWCYATLRLLALLLALPHILDATPLYVFLPCLTYMVLRYRTSSCTASHTWCYATVRLLGSGDGKTVTTKTSPSWLQRLWRTLSAEKREGRWGFWHVQWKVLTRALFKEIQLWERCKTTVIYGMKWMMNSANVGNAGSINHPPGCISMTFENLMCICETLKPRCIKQL